MLGPVNLRHILDLVEAAAELIGKHPERPFLGVPGLEKASEPPKHQRPEFTEPFLSTSPLVADTFKLVLDRIIFFSRQDTPLEFRQPEGLGRILGLNSYGPPPWLLPLIPNCLRNLVKSSPTLPHRGHPHYFYHLIGGMDPYTVAADWVASALNTPMLTYEDSPIFTLMERVVLQDLRLQIFGTPEGDGVITYGGSKIGRAHV